ncbi:hypothetical protein C7M84_021764 [Penaeus vannamei]|uniref:Uncharacterized protein n=1 Tax=Penaeus vannamei TaxID=6689 RepID=A0A3R7P3V2_PENVA|nr:hypothetical protein C7M84_021764 [Penaeus vannamei]
MFFSPFVPFVPPSSRLFSSSLLYFSFNSFSLVSHLSHPLSSILFPFLPPLFTSFPPSLSSYSTSSPSSFCLLLFSFPFSSPFVSTCFSFSPYSAFIVPSSSIFSSFLQHYFFMSPSSSSSFPYLSLLSLPSFFPPSLSPFLLASHFLLFLDIYPFVSPFLLISSLPSLHLSPSTLHALSLPKSSILSPLFSHPPSCLSFLPLSLHFPLPLSPHPLPSRFFSSLPLSLVFTPIPSSTYLLLILLPSSPLFFLPYHFLLVFLFLLLLALSPSHPPFLSSSFLSFLPRSLFFPLSSFPLSPCPISSSLLSPSSYFLPSRPSSSSLSWLPLSSPLLPYSPPHPISSLSSPLPFFLLSSLPPKSYFIPLPNLWRVGDCSEYARKQQ